MSHLFRAAVGLALLLITAPCPAQWSMDLETGVAFTGLNTIRIPADDGTRFSLTEDLSSDPAWTGRIRLNWMMTDRQTLSLLAAPLSVSGDGLADHDIRFEDTTFPAGTRLESTYRFDSYRLTWRFNLVRTKTTCLALGMSGKIRDAEIRIESDEAGQTSKNTGFVPLLSFRFEWRPSDRLMLLIDGDALAGPQGRAEDVLTAMSMRFLPSLSGYVGYRVLEGGADNDTLYTFALIHYAVIGISYRF